MHLWCCFCLGRLEIRQSDLSPRRRCWCCCPRAQNSHKLKKKKTRHSKLVWSGPWQIGPLANLPAHRNEFLTNFSYFKIIPIFSWKVGPPFLKICKGARSKGPPLKLFWKIFHSFIPESNLKGKGPFQIVSYTTKMFRPPPEAPIRLVLLLIRIVVEWMKSSLR